jgi:hypothetical protein
MVRCASATAATISAATMPSSHQWFAVATTTMHVAAVWSNASHRQRLVLNITTPTPTMSAHATCTDGIADIWSDNPWPTVPYTDCP